MLEGSCHCGNLKWKCEAKIDGITACNCTSCRRYGVLWAYGHIGQDIHVSGTTTAYMRDRRTLEFHFCPTCGCLSYWLGTSPNKEGHRRIAVNVRLANNPEEVMAYPIDHFDGLTTFDDLPRDGKCVKDIWF